MGEPVRWQHLGATGTITVSADGAYAQLVSVNVGTGAASAVLTVSNRASPAVVVAVIDCSAKGSYWYGGARLQGGLSAVLTGGNADVTVSYV